MERAVRRVIERCVELDPRPHGARGELGWSVDVARADLTAHHQRAILAEEELVLAWALDAHDDPPPRRPPSIDGLDVLQADAAAAVAGDDRLVLVVGPAGAGKTTMLRAAVDDLDASGRPVFGVAPSAKAARVLERETGVPPTRSPSSSTNGTAATGHPPTATSCPPARP
jgi:hypothetical protein